MAEVPAQCNTMSHSERSCQCPICDSRLEQKCVVQAQQKEVMQDINADFALFTVKTIIIACKKCNKVFLMCCAAHPDPRYVNSELSLLNFGPFLQKILCQTWSLWKFPKRITVLLSLKSWWKKRAVHANLLIYVLALLLPFITYHCLFMKFRMKMCRYAQPHNA